MIFPVLLVLFSFFTHFFFFGYPQEVVFDEVYFATFVGHYSSGAYYFDIHPPLAKLMTMFFGNVIGVTYGVDVSSIGNAMPWELVLLRILPLVAGALLPIVIYYICRHLNFSRLISFSAGLLAIFENSLLVQSRFLLFDSIMLLFGFSALLLYLAYARRGQGAILLLCSALLAAGAFGIKWTGLAYAFLIVVAEIVRTQKVRPVLRLVGLYAGVGLIVYLAIFALHFSYLIRAGPGDAFMTDRFQKTLKGNTYESVRSIEPKGFFGKTIELNIKMYEANKTLSSQHQYGSPWYTWPLMIRPVFYWQSQAASGPSSYIYLLGNPVIYWTSALAVVLLLFKIVKEKFKKKIPLFIIAGFLINFIPFAFIGRVMFLYHYEAALVFGIIAIGYILENYVPPARKILATVLMLGISLAAFIYFSPLTYGFPLSDEALQSRMWLKTWR